MRHACENKDFAARAPFSQAKHSSTGRLSRLSPVLERVASGVPRRCGGVRPGRSGTRAHARAQLRLECRLRRRQAWEQPPHEIHLLFSSHAARQRACCGNPRTRTLDEAVLHSLDAAYHNARHLPRARGRLVRCLARWAAGNGHDDVVRWLLQEEAVAVDTANKDGRTALMWGESDAFPPAARLCTGGGSLLQSSVPSSSLRCVKLAHLVGGYTHLRVGTHRLRVHKRSSTSDLDTRDLISPFGVCAACKNRQVSVVRYLLEEADADVTLRMRDDSTAFDWAVLGGHLETMEMLANHPKVDIHALNKFGVCPELRALRTGALCSCQPLARCAERERVWRALSERWRSLGSRLRCAAVQWAAAAGNVETCRWLFAKGVDFNHINRARHGDCHLHSPESLPARFKYLAVACLLCAICLSSVPSGSGLQFNARGEPRDVSAVLQRQHQNMSRVLSGLDELFRLTVQVGDSLAMERGICLFFML
eukprot:23885-Pleurochrysis_carterae.AAC.2